MKSFKIELKNGNFIKSYRDENTYGKIKLENGKTFNLAFKPNTMVVEVSQENVSQYMLTEEERIAIIERILTDCATFFNSILKASISLNIEEYKLVDYMTNNIKISKLTILEEFVISKYAQETENKVLKELLLLNEQINRNITKIGKEKVQLKLSRKFYIIEQNDVIYFLKHLLKRYAGLITFDKNKEFLILEPINN